jgi:hypothetical protein
MRRGTIITKKFGRVTKRIPLGFPMFLDSVLALTRIVLASRIVFLMLPWFTMDSQCIWSGVHISFPYQH